MTTLFESASQFAPAVDHLAARLLFLSTFFILLVFSLIVFFCVRYRATAQVNRANPPARNPKLEGSLIAVILIFGITTFWSSAKLFYEMYSPPENSREIFGVAKQWMWVFHEKNGKDQINEFTVTLNQPTKLTLISEDVIHSLYIPAFRIKQDVLPNRYTSLWFTPTKLGSYELFCTQYCGLSHSNMVARVHVVDAGLNPEAIVKSHSRGEALFQEKGCMSCHSASQDLSASIGPNLIGVFGKQIKLTNGQTITADEDYLRESILVPSAKIVEGYRNVMPPYQGLLNANELHEIIDYLKEWKAKSP